MRNALIKHRVENAKRKQGKPTKKTALNAALAPPAQFTSANFCKQVKSKTNTTMLYLSRAVSGACCRCMHDAHKKIRRQCVKNYHCTIALYHVSDGAENIIIRAVCNEQFPHTAQRNDLARHRAKIIIILYTHYF